MTKRRLTPSQGRHANGRQDVIEPPSSTRVAVRIDGVDEAALQRVEELARTRPLLTADDVVAALSEELEPDQLAEVHEELTRRGVRIEVAGRHARSSPSTTTRSSTRSSPPGG